MANLWSVLKGDEERQHPPLSQEQWQKMFGYNGRYPVHSVHRGKNTENPPTDFASYAEQLYAANPVVFGAMTARQVSFSEVRFQFQRMRNGKPGDLFGTSELEVLEKPGVQFTTTALLSRAVQDVDLAGNFYGLRSRDNRKKISRLAPNWVVIELDRPFDDADPSNIIGYSYHPGGIGYAPTEKIRFYEPDEIIHWAPYPDPLAQWRGMSPLTPTIREVMADSAASLHKLKYFENAATPNLAVSMKDINEDEFDAMVDAFNSHHRGVEYAYETIYLGGGADVKVVGADMRQMDFKVITGVAEARICAALRVHPSIVAISEGNQQGSFNQSVLRAAKDLFGDGTIRPLWASLCAAVESVITVPRDARLWYDDSDCSFFRDDKAETASIKSTESATLNGLVSNGWTQESAIEFIKSGDWSVLKHSGLSSVQLQKPGADMAPEKAAADIQQVEAATIASLVAQKFDRDSVIKAVTSGDWSQLKKDETPEPTTPAQLTQPGGEPLPQDKATPPDKGDDSADPTS